MLLELNAYVYVVHYVFYVLNPGYSPFILNVFFSISFLACSSTAFIDRVYVYRRPLSKLKLLGKKCFIAHSGLILKMKDGRECVLEYMGDSRAHLYNANYRITGWQWWARFRKAYSISFTDYQGDTYSWQATRQYYGKLSSKAVISLFDLTVLGKPGCQKDSRP